MCQCKEQKIELVGKMVVKKSWRLNTLFRIEKIIREIGQDSRAKRMGICGNTIHIMVKKDGDVSSVLFQPQLRCKDRLCPVCNAYRASILARKVEKIGENMSNPHMLTLTANIENRFDLATAFKNFKHSMKKLKNNKSWFKKYIKGGVEHIEVVHNKNTGWHIHAHMIVDLNYDRKVNNLYSVVSGYEVEPIKKELEIVLERVGLGTISDIRPVTEGYGKEISKYCTKFGFDIADVQLKEIVIGLKGKRMFSKFGSCYGVGELDEGLEDTLEELSLEEKREYRNIGTINEVVEMAFKDGVVKIELFHYVQEGIRIGLIELAYEEIERTENYGTKCNVCI